MAVKRTVPVIHAETQDYKTDILVCLELPVKQSVVLLLRHCRLTPEYVHFIRSLVPHSENLRAN